MGFMQIRIISQAIGIKDNRLQCNEAHDS